MDLSSFLTFLGERTFFVSITILVLLAIRPLAKKLPRKGMYFLWVILVLRILCPVNFTGIYHLLPAANATNAQIYLELSFGGAMNLYRLLLLPKHDLFAVFGNLLRRIRHGSRETIF